MKKIKNLKKKIFGLTLVVGLLVLSIVGTTMAYFTDVDEKTNVFTSGNVAITLASDVLYGDNNNAERINTYPGMNIGSAATVTNTGSEDAYVGIIVTFNKAITEANVRALFTNLVSEGYTVTYESANNTTKLYISSNTALNTTDNKTVTFFGGMTVPASWDHAEMVMFQNLDINIAAYATQTYGFTNAETALRTAFAAWPTVSNGN